MLTFWKASILVALVVALLSPLLYALNTLIMLKRKRVYPIFRVRGSDAQMNSLIVEARQKKTRVPDLLVVKA